MILNVLLLHTDAITSAKITQYHNEKHTWQHWERELLKGSWGIRYEGICVGILRGSDGKEPATYKRRVPSLGLEDPLEKEMATHSSILAWRISWMKETGRLQSTGWQRVGHDWSDWARMCGLTKQRLPKYRMRPFPLNCASFRWCYNQHFITWLPKRIPFVENF